MDLAFLRRAEARFASRAPAHIDYGMLLALLQTQQAKAHAQTGTPAEPSASRGRREALITLLSGGADWRRASLALCGSFSPAMAAAGNPASTQMTGKFTFAFQPSFNASGLGQCDAGGFAPRRRDVRGFE